MPKHVTLVENTLEHGPPLRPRVVDRVNVELDEVLRYMAMDTAIEEHDMRLAVGRLGVGRLGDALESYLAKGDRVNTPWERLSPT